MVNESIAMQLISLAADIAMILTYPAEFGKMYTIVKLTK